MKNRGFACREALKCDDVRGGALLSFVDKSLLQIF